MSPRASRIAVVVGVLVLSRAIAAGVPISVELLDVLPLSADAGLGPTRRLLPLEPTVLELDGGAALLVWSDDRFGNRNLLAAYVESRGVGGLPFVLVGDSEDQRRPRLGVQDGGVILVWDIERGGKSNASVSNVFGLCQLGPVALDSKLECRTEEMPGRLPTFEVGGPVLGWLEISRLRAEKATQNVDSTGVIDWAFVYKGPFQVHYALLRSDGGVVPDVGGLGATSVMTDQDGGVYLTSGGSLYAYPRRLISDAGIAKVLSIEGSGEFVGLYLDGTLRRGARVFGTGFLEGSHALGSQWAAVVLDGGIPAAVFLGDGGLVRPGENLARQQYGTPQGSMSQDGGATVAVLVNGVSIAAFDLSWSSAGFSLIDSKAFDAGGPVRLAVASSKSGRTIFSMDALGVLRANGADLDSGCETKPNAFSVADGTVTARYLSNSGSGSQVFEAASCMARPIAMPVGAGSPLLTCIDDSDCMAVWSEGPELVRVGFPPSIPKVIVRTPPALALTHTQNEYRVLVDLDGSVAEVDGDSGVVLNPAVFPLDGSGVRRRVDSVRAAPGAPPVYAAMYGSKIVWTRGDSGVLNVLTRSDGGPLLVSDFSLMTPGEVRAGQLIGAFLVRELGGEIAVISFDAGANDIGPSDAGSPDAGTSDAGTSDAGTGDAGTSDAGTSDAGTSDAGTSDAGASDAGASDAGASDAGASDAGTSDAGGNDDAGVLDAGATDGGVTNDAGALDAGLPDAGTRDAGAPPDGGSVDPELRFSSCGCDAVDAELVMLGVLLLSARRRSGRRF